MRLDIIPIERTVEHEELSFRPCSERRVVAGDSFVRFLPQARFSMCAAPTVTRHCVGGRSSWRGSETDALGPGILPALASIALVTRLSTAGKLPSIECPVGYEPEAAVCQPAGLVGLGRGRGKGGAGKRRRRRNGLLVLRSPRTHRASNCSELSLPRRSPRELIDEQASPRSVGIMRRVRFCAKDPGRWGKGIALSSLGCDARGG